MPIRVRTEPLGQAIEALIDRTLSPEAAKKQLIDFALKEVAKADRQNQQALGRVPAKAIYVNGKLARSLSEVTVPGTLIVEYEVTSDMVEQMMAYLRREAPFLTGRFRDSIWIYADGVRVATPEQVIGAEEVILVPTVAYARKIERGQGKFQGKLFENAAKYAMKKFRGSGAKFKFSFVDVVGGDTHLGRWARKRTNRNRHQVTRDRRNPALVIRFK